LLGSEVGHDLLGSDLNRSHNSSVVMPSRFALTTQDSAYPVLPNTAITACLDGCRHPRCVPNCPHRDADTEIPEIYSEFWFWSPWESWFWKFWYGAFGRLAGKRVSGTFCGCPSADPVLGCGRVVYGPVRIGSML